MDLMQSTVRLWSLDTYTNLVCYKSHNYPIWDVEFGPYGFYFATASHDKTARLWSCDHINPLRIFAGHLSDVNVSNNKHQYTEQNCVINNFNEVRLSDSIPIPNT